MRQQTLTQRRIGGQAATRNVEPSPAHPSAQATSRRRPSVDPIGTGAEQGLVEYASWLMLLRKRLA